MSRLSKFIRGKNIKLGPIVKYLVKLVEVLLGGGEGAAKKKLVADLIATILKRAEAAGSKTPEGAPVVVDELIDQTVSVYNEVGWPSDSLPDTPTTEPAKVEPAPEPKRRGRKPGVKNIPNRAPVDKNIHTPDPAVAMLPDFEDDDFDLTDLKFDDED